MSRRKCSACGNNANKLRRRPVYNPHERTLTPGMVCTTCWLNGLAICVMTRKQPCSLCTPGHEADAKVCLSCAKDIGEKAVKGAWVPYVKRIRKLAKAYKLNDDGRAEGLTMAADMLERGGISLTEEGTGE